jgi:hypothetical protein
MEPTQSNVWIFSRFAIFVGLHVGSIPFRLPVAPEPQDLGLILRVWNCNTLSVFSLWNVLVNKI